MTLFDLLLKPNIGKFEKKRDVAGLVKALSHKDAAIRKTAAVALGKMKAKESIDALAGLLGDGDIPVRLAAVDSLGKLKDLRATAHLMQALKTSDNQIKRGVINAISRIKSDDVLNAIIAESKNESVPVREAVVNALSSFDVSDATDVLVLATQDKHESVRHKAVQALHKRSHPLAREILAKQQREQEIKEKYKKGADGQPLHPRNEQPLFVEVAKSLNRDYPCPNCKTILPARPSLFRTHEIKSNGAWDTEEIKLYKAACPNCGQKITFHTRTSDFASTGWMSW